MMAAARKSTAARAAAGTRLQLSKAFHAASMAWSACSRVALATVPTTSVLRPGL